MIRIRSETSIPRHHQTLRLRALPRVIGWCVVVFGLGGGFALVSQSTRELGEIGGTLLVLLGGGTLWAMLRCHTCNVTIGTTRIDLTCGPLRLVAATAGVSSAERRPAGGWRRLFAESEVILKLDYAASKPAFPASDPDEFIAAIDDSASTG